LFDRLFQHLPELRSVSMTVNLHRMLYGNFEQFFFTVRGYCNRAFALRRHFSAINVFSGHVFSLKPVFAQWLNKLIAAGF
jgi:hypothetical protein